MRRFYIHPGSIAENLAILSPEESRHIATVLRLEAGTAIELFDGTGFVYQGLILTISPKRITVEILSRYREEEDETPQLFLFQSILKGKKMDFLIQKATELGVHSFTPITSRYNENHGNLPRQTERWQRIMFESCKQCKRALPMTIAPVTALEDIDIAPFEHPLVLWEGEKSVFLDATAVSFDRPMALLVGPEGGFHADEIKMAVEKGFKPVSLGRRILRAETAAICAISILQFLCGALSASART